MKSKRLLLMLLMALLVPWAAQAQETLTVNDGTTLDEYVPVYGYYVDSQGTTSEFIIPANTEGMSDMEGGTISKLTFYISGSPASWGSPTIQLYLGEVEGTTLSGVNGPTNFTVVKTMVWSNQQSTIEVEFDEPYTYGGGNLLIGTYVASAGGYKHTYFFGVSAPSGSGYCHYSSSNDSRSFLPKTTFTYEAAAGDCPKPNNFVASNVTAHTADLSWESDGFEFVLEYKKASDSNWTQKWPDVNSYTLTGLDAETEYQARVAAFHETCPTDPETGDHVQSDWREISFTTGVACPAPTALEFALTLGDGTVATLSWIQEGDVNEWDVEYSTAAEFGNFQTVNASGTPTAELQNLTPETTYYARVKTYCGSEGYSQYSNVVTFTPTDAYTLTVNDGTTTNGNVPVYGTWVDGTVCSQFIIPAATLETIQYGIINQMTFYAGTDKPWTNAEFEVYMAEVDNSTISAMADWTTMTKVMNAAHLEISNGIMVVTLDNPYQYLGGNLMIGVLETQSGTWGSSNFYGISATGASMGGQTSSPSQQNFLPKTTFNYIPGEAPSCLRPTNLEVSDITTDAAVLTWTAGGSETAWEVEVSGGEQVTTWNANETTFTLPGLNHSTHYSVKVRAICGGEDQSDWSMPVSFTTACGVVVDFPWSYDFENDAAGDFANPCWVNEHISGYGTQIFKVSTSSLGSNSTHQLQLPDMSNGTLTKLMLPEMTLPGDNYLFSIDVFRNTSTANYGEGIRVFVSTDGEIEGATELAFISRSYTTSDGNLIPAESASGWYTYELPLGISGTCYIILRGESKYGSATYMDNFAVMQAPTCVKPTNLAQTHTNHSATLSWTAGNEGQNAWQIAYSTTSFNPNAADFDLTTVEVIDNVEETSYTFDKTLNANTHYYMYVRGYCGDEDYSKWVGIDFTTGTANPSPTVTTVDEITPVSAVLRWTAAGGDYLESYDIYYSQTSGQPANDSLIQYTGVDAGFTSKILENLTEGYWYVYMRAYHGETDGYSSWTPYYGYGFQVPEACPEPTNLTAGNPTPNSITLTWTEGAEWQYAWKVAYSTDPEFNPEEMDPETFVDVFGQQGPTITCTVNGLESETTYYFKVLGNCNNPYGDSDWTDAVSETTLEGCPVPFDINVTTASNTATINWTGFSDSYTVQYRTAGGYDVELVEGFESGSMPAGWTIEGDNQVSTKTWQVGVGDYSTSTGTHSGDYNALIKHNSDGNETYLITPALDFSGVSEASLNLWYINRSWGGDIDEFGVYYRVNGGEWNELFSTTEAHSTWTELNLTLTGLAANTQIGFKCYDGYGYGIGLDDITILGGEYNEPGQWVEANTNTESVTLDLAYGMKYEAQVKAECSDYGDMFTFTTKSLKLFTTDGDWSVASNWTPAGAPTMGEDAKISAAATINAGVVANADIITIDGGSITIEDGGQLVANSDVTNVTVEKDIVGYTEPNYETNNGYYFIANPTTTSLYPSEVENLINETVEHYDLYAWSTSYGQPWKNYKQNEFSTLEKVTLNTHDAYLYANMDDVTLKFNGTVISSQNRKGYNVYVNNNEFGAWNLVGNPFVCNAYLVANDGYALPYYKMNADGNGYEATTGEAIAPATGIFYEAPASGQVYFTREDPFIIRNGVLNMNLRSNNKQLDNAIVRFGEGQQMSKFSFRENSTKVYIPMDGIDYAVVNAGQAGEMPVSFKAEKNGNYTLSFTSQEVSFSYLHLIDNMTGDDVNLLETPYYSFNAQTTDYANRFRLVFATGSSTDGDSFGFINGAGNLSIFGIEGEATVQVVDVLGHVLSSETFSGSYERKLDVAPGVYMVRLIQGNDIKVQKMVIK